MCTVCTCCMYMCCRYLREELLEVQVWATAGTITHLPSPQDELLALAQIHLDALLSEGSVR